MKKLFKSMKPLSLWKFNHYALEKGNDSLGFPKEKSTDLLNYLIP